MGLLQGATELFPVSSLGHSVIIPSLLHWRFKQSDPAFVPFLVLLHLGTAGALLVLYRSEWVEIIRGFFAAALRGSITTPAERLAMLLLTGTIPAAILGGFFETRIKSLFSSAYVAAAVLGAGIVEVPQLFSTGVPLGEYLAAAVLSALAAYASARFLLRYFRSGRLDPYGWYCVGAGLASLALLHFSL